MKHEFKTLTLKNTLSTLNPRDVTAHKGLFGHVLVIGGDYGMGGAVRLAGEAALRSGAGLVSLVTRPEHAYAITGNCPELMCHGVEEAGTGTDAEIDITGLLTKANVVVIGPGLGQSAWAEQLFAQTVHLTLPIIVDGDALALVANLGLKRNNWILTPHPGEAARLLQLTTAEIQADRIAAIQQLQKRYHGVIVLKGSGTLVLGEEAAYCEFGNPGMATAGMGDVLAGIIGALVAQKMSLENAARLGVVAHAVAGDTLAEKYGPRGMKASDLFSELRTCLNG